MRAPEVSKEMWWRAHWVNRIFGSWAAYEASLPDRVWLQGGNGWYSESR